MRKTIKMVSFVGLCFCGADRFTALTDVPMKRRPGDSPGHLDPPLVTALQHTTHMRMTQTSSRQTYRASVPPWSSRIPHGRTPILWRSWPSRPPCAGSPTQQRQARQRGQRSVGIHLRAMRLILLGDESLRAPAVDRSSCRTEINECLLSHKGRIQLLFLLKKAICQMEDKPFIKNLLKLPHILMLDWNHRKDVIYYIFLLKTQIVRSNKNMWGICIT